ncbi:MAG TPA: DUF2628 domain-containing protein [Ramlibacter sp.]|nr:DUF2628 domain-containing protein [Ramlibacter sp.]
MYTNRRGSSVSAAPREATPEPQRRLVYLHPTNSHVEEVDLAWIWTLAFGMFYLAWKGLWRHVVIQILLLVCFASFTSPLGVGVMVIIIHIVYACLCEEILAARLLRLGYQPVYVLSSDDRSSLQLAPVRAVKAQQPPTPSAADPTGS